MPIATTVSMPFTLEPQAHAIQTPVPINQPHHSGVNGLQEVSKGPEWWKGILNIHISQLTEANVGIHGKREEKDEGSVQ
jgi:hypothetical protein